MKTTRQKFEKGEKQGQSGNYLVNMQTLRRPPGKREMVTPNFYFFILFCLTVSLIYTEEMEIPRAEMFFKK